MIDRLSGPLLAFTIVAVVAAEWGGGRPFYLAAGVAVVSFLVLVLPTVPWSRRVFVAVGVGFVLMAAATRPDFAEMIEKALASAAFVVAFFCALVWLRLAASTSPTIERCGRFLADQPPGRRYLALTLGAHLYGLVLSYGTISLLGSLAESGARREPDPELRAIRLRRMLLAINRGFIATTCWSPLTYSIAISTSIVPGADWSAAVGFCLVNAAVIAGLGWALDTVFKPRLATPPPARRHADGSWSELKPLFALLAVILGSAGLIQWLTGIRAVAVLMVVVPLISLGWIALQGRGTGEGPLRHMRRRAASYVFADAPAYRSDLVLLAMAGFIGTLGSGLTAPVLAAMGIDLGRVPAWLILVGLVWLIPLTGQLGMNPILSVYLIAPLLPAPEMLGVSPSAVIVALTAGWALTGVSSPFTATILLVAAFARVSPLHVGWKWNGPFTLIGGVILSAWAVMVAAID